MPPEFGVPQVPEVEIYVREKYALWWAFIRAGGTPLLGSIVLLGRLPNSAFEWVVVVLMMVVTISASIRTRKVPMPEQAGAMLFNKEAVRRLPTEEIASINEAVDRKVAVQKEEGIR